MTDSEQVETGESEIPSTGRRAVRPGAKRGVPRGSLEEVEKHADALWEAARLRSVPLAAYASELGHPTMSGGAYRAKLALIRVFGVMKEQDGNVALSDIGRKIVNASDPSAQEEGRREAVLQVSVYKELLSGAEGTPLPSKASIAGRMEFSYGLSKQDSDEAAKDFIASVERAGFLHDGIVVLEPENPQEISLEGAGDVPRTPPVQAIEEDSGLLGRRDTTRSGPASSPPPQPPLVRAVHTSPAISVSVSLDLSNFEAEDVIKIARALGITERHDG